MPIARPRTGRDVKTQHGNSPREEIRKAVTRDLATLNLPTGTRWSFGSAFENENATQQEMLVNLLLALVLVYLVMAALFESLLHPFAIMFALPFAFVGIAWISFLTGSPFNLMAQIGLLMTTATTIPGLLPLAVGQNRVGDVLYFPLARTVIGGLAAATLLTLILVPCLYTLIEGGAGLVQRVWRSGARAD